MSSTVSAGPDLLGNWPIKWHLAHYSGKFVRRLGAHGGQHLDAHADLPILADLPWHEAVGDPIRANVNAGPCASNYMSRIRNSWFNVNNLRSARREDPRFPLDFWIPRVPSVIHSIFLKSITLDTDTALYFQKSHEHSALV